MYIICIYREIPGQPRKFARSGKMSYAFCTIWKCLIFYKVYLLNEKNPDDELLQHFDVKHYINWVHDTLDAQLLNKVLFVETCYDRLARLRRHSSHT